MNKKERELVLNGQAITALRLYKNRTGCTLSEAKKEMDKIREERNEMLKQNKQLNSWMNKTFFGVVKCEHQKK